MICLSPDDFTRLALFIEKASGIHLDASKTYLVENRLAPLLESERLGSFAALHRKLSAGGDPRLLSKVIDSISTHETSFFRDKEPFNLIQFKLLPDLIDRQALSRPGRAKKIDIWCTACSTGQEVYSLAIIHKEMLGNKSLDYLIRIVGTDISDPAIKRSSRGRYDRFEMARGLPPQYQNKYFVRHDHFWQVGDELRAMVHFRNQNLMESFAGLRKFDLILCRNVAMYFTLTARRSLFDRLADSLFPGGCLIVGATEQLQQMTKRFARRNHHNTTYYQLLE